MTIPTLVNSYQKQVAVTRLQKVYSTLSQAIKLSEVDNGTLENWDWSKSSTDVLSLYLVPYLKISRLCGTNEGCWGNENKVIKFLNGGIQTDLSAEGAAFSLPDGTNILFLNQETTHGHFYIDLNGDKAPNTYAKDCFVFTLAKQPFIEGRLHDIKLAGLYMYAHGGTEDTCKKSSTGWSCDKKIQQDGWKISDDYPW